MLKLHYGTVQYNIMLNINLKENNNFYSSKTKLSEIDRNSLK